MKKSKVPGLAKNIKIMRINSGLTLESAAKKLGLSGKTSFASYESGDAEPSLTTILKMRDLFKEEIEDILGGTIRKQKKYHFNKCLKCKSDVKTKSGRPLNSQYCNDCYWL